MRSRRNVAPDRFTCLVSELFILTITVGAIGFILAAVVELFYMAMEAL